MAPAFQLSVITTWLALTAIVSANPVLDWNAQMIDAIRLDNSGPTVSSRNLAILHVCLHDTLNSISNRYQPYQVQLGPSPDCSPASAVHAAGREIMNVLYPGSAGITDQRYQAFLNQMPKDAALTNGLALGLQIAQIALNNRAGDGSTTDIPYIPSAEPGSWQRTPPFFRPPFTPHWRYVQPFALPDVMTFTPGPPPPLNSPAYAAALNEVKLLGDRNSSVRTPEQSQIATFWSDFSYTSMPPGHWHVITDSIARSRGLRIDETARLFALISIAQADVAIVCWEAKFRYNLWRPITAIQRASEDNNPATDADAEWGAFLSSPPFPAYFSGHSSFSAASADILARFFGSDQVRFTATSDSLPGVTREFTSLSACADEIGLSRIYGGIHFSFDNEEGKKSGRQIARYVAENLLLPTERLPALFIESATATQINLRLHARYAQGVVLEASPDLRSWITVAHPVPQVGGVPVSYPTTTNVFFRLRESPVTP